MNDHSIAYKNRLVLLPVDPYLIHAYWRIAPAQLHDASQQATAAQAVLRLHTDGEWFDIDVDLQSSNWYVHLWKPEQTLRAELALKREDGTVIRLAQSEVTQMPRVAPALARDRHIMKVEDTKPEPRIAAPASPTAPPVEPDVQPVKPIAPQQVSPQPEREVPVRSSAIKPIRPSQTVKEKLRSLYSSLQWRRHDHVIEPEKPSPVDSGSIRTANADLTALAEKKLAIGVSSSSLQKENEESRPSSRQ
jgi:hypothetical protein